MASKKKVTKKQKTKGTTAAAKPAVARQPVHLATATPSPAKSGVRHLAGRPNKTAAQQQARLAALMNKVNLRICGKDGPPILIPADEASSNSYLRRPTGIMQLDVDLGGGFPAQSLVTIGGPPQAGKSTLLYHTFAQHQRLYGGESYIAMATPEGGIDYEQAHRCGWKVPTPKNVIEAIQAARKLQGYPQLTTTEVGALRESVGTNIIVRTGTMEAMLDAIEELLDSHTFGIIGIDSYESLIPRSEAGLDSLEDNGQQASRANIITRFLQHYGPIKDAPEHYTTLMMTTQVRTNRKKAEAPGAMQKYISDFSDDKAAWALQHWRSIHVSVGAGEKIKGGDKRTIGKQFTWKLSKGKEGTHDNIHGSTPYYYDKRCFNQLDTVVLAGMKYGVIRETDGKLTFYRNGNPDDYLYQIEGKEQFTQAMQEEEPYEWAVRREICMAAGFPGIYC